MRFRIHAIVALLLLCALFAPAAVAQYTTVSASSTGGTGHLVANGTIYWQLLTSARIGTAGGQYLGVPITATVTAGAFSISTLDTSLSDPQYPCYAVTILDNLTGKVLLGAGLANDGIHVNAGGSYGCVQPSGSTWSFDSFIPPGPATAEVVAGPAGATGPQGPQGNPGTGGCGSGGGSISGGCTGATTAAAAVSNLLGNPAPGTYSLDCTNASSCAPVAATSGVGSDGNYYHWATALAAVLAQSANARVCMAGDSTQRGFWSLPSGNQVFYAPALQLSRILQSQYHIQAQAANWFGSASSLYISPYQLLSADSRLSVNSAWAGNPSNQVPGGYAMTASSAGTLAFTPTENVNTFRIFYLKNSSAGVISANIDGGTATTQSTSGSPGIGVLTLTASTVGAHTLNVTWSSGGPVDLWGEEGYDSTSHMVLVELMGNGGGTSANFADRSNPYGAGYSLPWATLGCDLTVYEAGINDWGTSIAVSTFSANMQTVISALLATGADVALVSGNPSGNQTPAVMLPYVAALQALAESNSNPGLSVPLPWINNWAMFSGPANGASYGWTYSNDHGAMASDGEGNLHPNLFGYAAFAESVAAAIMTNPAQSQYLLANFAASPTINSPGTELNLYITDPPWSAACDGSTDDHAVFTSALYYGASLQATNGPIVLNLPPPTNAAGGATARTCSISSGLGLAGPVTLEGNGANLQMTGTGDALIIADGTGANYRPAVKDLHLKLTATTGSVTGILAARNFELDNVSIQNTTTYPTAYTSVAIGMGTQINGGIVNDVVTDGPWTIDGSGDAGPSSQTQLSIRNSMIGGTSCGSGTIPSSSMLSITNWRGAPLWIDSTAFYVSCPWGSSPSIVSVTNTSATNFGVGNAVMLNIAAQNYNSGWTILKASNSGGGSAPILYGNIDTAGYTAGSITSGSWNGLVNIGNVPYVNDTASVSCSGSPSSSFASVNGIVTHC